MHQRCDQGFVNGTLSGVVPHSDLLVASRCIALRKRQGGVRSVAVGVAFLEVTSICALSTVHTAAHVLAPFEVGVGIHGVRKSRAKHSDRPSPASTWSTSCSTAFNLCDRSAMTKAVSEHLPGLRLCVQMSYHWRPPVLTVCHRRGCTHHEPARVPTLEDPGVLCGHSEGEQRPDKPGSDGCSRWPRGGRHCSRACSFHRGAWSTGLRSHLGSSRSTCFSRTTLRVGVGPSNKQHCTTAATGGAPLTKHYMSS